ncbi:MAG: hypothetical protein QM739_19725 [Propionivibrio sp.]
MASRLWIAAAREPARSEPVKSQLRRPSVIGRIAEPAQEAADPALVQAEINALRTQLAALDAELKRRDLKIQQLTLEFACLKRIRFGCKSEALTAEQRDLFLETSDEDGAAIDAELVEEQTPTDAPRTHKRRGRNPLPPELPRIEHRHEPESCTCGACGRDLVKIGEDSGSERPTAAVWRVPSTMACEAVSLH